MLATTLGASQLLAQPGSGRLCLLNASAAAVWARHEAGAEAAAIVRWLTATYALPESIAHQQVAALYAAWHQAVLLDTPAAEAAVSADWVIPVPPAIASPGADWLTLAGTAFALHREDGGWARALAPLLQPFRRAPAASHAHALRLTGAPDDWTLWLNGQPAASGTTADAAITTILHTLFDLACRAADRLLVIHGAGLVLPDGTGLLLVAPGGSGKTTLATALNAEGLGLLSDDVVPVDQDGRLLGLGAPICLKAGSWPVLTAHRPDLEQWPTLQRLGQTIRYLPPCGSTPASPIPLGRLLFPRYQPGSIPHTEPLTPEQALQALIEAEAVIRNLTQSKLDALARWVSSVPAYALTYPDLRSGLGLVKAWRGGP